MIQRFLSQMGLTHNEQVVYLYLLEHGSSIASILAKRLNIKRVTIYAILESLSKKTLVRSFQKNDIKYFEASSPEEIITLCEKKVSESIELKEKAQHLLSSLKKIQAKQIRPLLEVKGKIKYYQGLDAVKALIDETLEEGKREQLCFGLNKYHTDHLWDEWKDYTHKRAKIGMNVRSIQPDTKPAQEYKKRDEEELRETRLIPHKQFPAQCELNIIGDMIAIFSSHGESPTGMKLYDAQMAQTLKSLFELAWLQSKNYSDR